MLKIPQANWSNYLRMNIETMRGVTIEFAVKLFAPHTSVCVLGFECALTIASQQIHSTPLHMGIISLHYRPFNNNHLHQIRVTPAM